MGRERKGVMSAKLADALHHGSRPEETRRLIEGRICQGPPRDWFNADADMQKILDRARFDLLGDMDRAGRPRRQCFARCAIDIQTGGCGRRSRRASTAGRRATAAPPP